MAARGRFMATLSCSKMKKLATGTQKVEYPTLKMALSSATKPQNSLIRTDNNGQTFPLSRSCERRERENIVVIGLSFNATPIGKKKMFLPQAEWPRAISELCSSNHIQEATLLTTIDRLEIYVVALSVNRAVREVTEWMSETTGITIEDISHHRFLLYNDDAVHYLFEYSVGLNSTLVQVVNSGQGGSGFGTTLSALFNHAISFSKQADVDGLRAAMVAAEVKEFSAWRESLEAAPTMTKLRGYAEEARVAEVEKWVGRMGGDVSIETRQALEGLSRGIVAKLLHGPTELLKSDGRSSTEMVENVTALNRMFGLSAWEDKLFR